MFLKSLLLNPPDLGPVSLLVSEELSVAEVCALEVLEGLDWVWDFRFKALGISITCVLATPRLKEKIA